MKKFLLLAIWVFVLSTVSALPVSMKPSKGIKAGFASSKIIGDDAADDLDSKIGFCAGFFIEIPHNSNFSLQPEFCFVSRGFEQEKEGIDYTYTFNYFQIPVLLKIKPLPYNRTALISPYFVGGAYFAFNTSTNVKTGNTEEDTEDHLDDIIKVTDFGFIIGGGIELTNGVGLEIRYEKGLTEVYDFSGSEIYEFDAFNSSLVFNLFVKIL